MLMAEEEKVTLRDYMDRRFEDFDKAVLAAHNATERALEKADKATEKRFDGVNEFRAVLTDQQRTFLTRAEFESEHASLIARVDSLEDWRASASGQEAGSWRSIERLILICSLIAAVAIVFVEWFRK
jgi:hypothetical protein